MNLACKVGQFRLRFAHLEKMVPSSVVEQSLRFDSQTESASSNTLPIWIIWLEESIKNRFWESYLFEERAKISAILFLKNVRFVSTVCAGLLTICEMEYDCEWKLVFESVYLPKGRVFRTNLRVRD